MQFYSDEIELAIKKITEDLETRDTKLTKLIYDEFNKAIQIEQLNFVQLKENFFKIYYYIDITEVKEVYNEQKKNNQEVFKNLEQKLMITDENKELNLFVFEYNKKIEQLLSNSILKLQNMYNDYFFKIQNIEVKYD